MTWQKVRISGLHPARQRPTDADGDEAEMHACGRILVYPSAGGWRYAVYSNLVVGGWEATADDAKAEAVREATAGGLVRLSHPTLPPS